MFTVSTQKLAPSKISKRQAPYHHGSLRQSLIDVGLQLIAESGVRALTLREIGNRLGVSRMAPYRHFKDKGALLAAITTAGFTKFGEALRSARDSAGSDWEAQANALAVAYVRFARENKAHFEVMFGGGGEPQYLNEAGIAVAEASFSVLEALVRDGQESGNIVGGDPTLLAQMIWATVHGISTLGLGIPQDCSPEQPDFVLYCAELLRTGLRPRG